MTKPELDALIDRLQDGEELARRVVVNAQGLAVDPWRAEMDHDVVPAVVFVRKDGWTLGAPVAFAGVAWSLWADQWIAIVALSSVTCRRVSGN